MEKRHLDRRLAQMVAEGTEFRPASTWASTSPPTSCRPTSTPIVLAGGATQARDLPDPGPRARRHPPGHGVPAARRTGCSRATSPAPTIDGQGQARRDHRRRRHRRRLPGHRPPPGRGVDPPVRDHAAAARRPARLHAVAHLAAHVPHVVGPRGGRRAGVLGQHRVLPRRRRRRRAGAAGPRGRDGRRPLREGRGQRLRAARASCVLWPWASPAPSAAALARAARRRARPPRQRGPRRRLGDQRRRRVRGRRHGPGPEPHRVGHRRGPLVRRRGRPLPRGRHAPAGTHRADRRAASADRPYDARDEAPPEGGASSSDCRSVRA